MPKKSGMVIIFIMISVFLAELYMNFNFSGTNMVLNGGFENGVGIVPSTWICTGASRETAEKHSGTYSIKFFSSGVIEQTFTSVLHDSASYFIILYIKSANWSSVYFYVGTEVWQGMYDRKYTYITYTGASWVQQAPSTISVSSISVVSVTNMANGWRKIMLKYTTFADISLYNTVQKFQLVNTAVLSVFVDDISFG